MLIALALVVLTLIAGLSLNLGFLRYQEQQMKNAVTVNNPPESCPFIDNIEYLEVIVAQAQPTFFMRVAGFNSLNVRGLAVASSAGKTRLGASRS